MKILHWAIVFIAIILPMSLICRITVNSKYEALKDEVRINNAVDTATKDAIDQIIAVSGYDYDEEFGDVINITPELAQETVNTFFHTLAVNYNIPFKVTDATKLADTSDLSYIKNYFAPYIPAVVVVAYDGFYVYSQEQNPADGTFGYKLSSKIPFAYEGNGYYIGYTLGDDIYLHANNKIYSGKIMHNSLNEVVTAYNDLLATYSSYMGGSTPTIDEVATLCGNDISILMYHLSKTSGITFREEILPKAGVTNFIQDYSYDKDGNYTVGDFHQNRRKTIISIISASLREEINVEHNRFKNILGVTYNFALPEMSEQSWVNTINDISVMAFVQGIPVGTVEGQYYNSYALGGSQIVKKNYLYANVIQSSYTGNGVKLYHQHDCPLIQNDKYDFIFITEDGAIAEGYHACQLCN